MAPEESAHFPQRKELRARGVDGDMEIAAVAWVKWIPPRGLAQVPAGGRAVTLRCSGMFPAGLQLLPRKEQLSRGFLYNPCQAPEDDQDVTQHLHLAAEPEYVYLWAGCRSGEACLNWEHWEWCLESRKAPKAVMNPRPVWKCGVCHALSWRNS